MSSDQDVQREIEQLEQRFAENSRGLVFAHLADAYRRAHEYAKAEGLILHGLKNHPSYISAYNVLGRIYLDSDRLADAHEQFTRVLELDPHNLIALRALGDLAARAGHADEARSWYEQMLQVDPRNDAVREEIRRLSEQQQGGDGPRAPEAEVSPEATPADASDAASTTHPGSTPESAAGGEEGEASSEERGMEAGALGIMDAGDLGDLVDEVPDALAEEMDARSLEAMPWEDIRDVSSLDLEAGAEVDQGQADRTAVEPEEVEAEHIGSVDAEVEERLEALMEREAPPEGEVTEEEAQPVTSYDQEHVVDLTDLDDWTPGLFEEEPSPGSEADAPELEADNFIDALERGFDPEAEAAEEEPASPGQGVPGEGLVTETMAELYARQGLHAEALRVYRQLAESRPGEERLQQRIAELEEKLVPESEETEEAELVELLDITGMTEEAGEGIAGEEVEADAAAGTELESGSEAPTEAMAGPAAETAGDVSPETEAEDREAESALEDVTAAAAFAGAFEESSGDGEFEFGDEVPVAGLEQLDPFAASFEVMGRPESQEPSEADEVGAGVPSPQDGDEGEVSVADAELQDVGGVDAGTALAGMTSRETDESSGGEDEVARGIGSLPDAGQAEPEESGEADVAGTSPDDAPTIERYLFELLEFDSDIAGADAGSNPVSRPRAEADASPSREPKPETEPAASSEDLEHFQEWLRGLRH